VPQPPRHGVAREGQPHGLAVAAQLAAAVARAARRPRPRPGLPAGGSPWRSTQEPVPDIAHAPGTVANASLQQECPRETPVAKLMAYDKMMRELPENLEIFDHF